MTCFQVGREQSGQIGAVGAYGSFGDDGRFHPFTFSDVGFGTCVPNDAHQHAFVNVAYANAPASASGEPCPTVRSRLSPAHARTRLRARLTAQSHAPDCEPRNQRLVAFGLLGPDATSVTYRTAHGTATTPTHGPDGAYLIVEPVEPGDLRHANADTPAVAAATAMRLPIGLIAKITYRDAPDLPRPAADERSLLTLRTLRRLPRRRLRRPVSPQGDRGRRGLARPRPADARALLLHPQGDLPAQRATHPVRRAGPEGLLPDH